MEWVQLRILYGLAGYGLVPLDGLIALSPNVFLCTVYAEFTYMDGLW